MSFGNFLIFYIFLKNEINKVGREKTSKTEYRQQQMNWLYFNNKFSE